MSPHPIKEVAVTGASGFIGAHLVEFLLSKGLDVRVLIHHTDLPLNVIRYRGSILDRKGLEKFLAGVDLVFHMAAALGSRGLSRREFYAINRTGVTNVLSSAHKMGVKRIVLYSSAGVYGKTSGLVPLEEGDPLNPVDIYERSKRAGEDAALAFKGKVHWNIIRPGWVYGPGDKRTFKLIRQIDRGPFFIAGKGVIKHSPIYIRDLIRASWEVAQRGPAGEIFNAGGAAVSVEEMVRIIARVLEKNSTSCRMPLWLTLPAAWMCEKLFAMAGKEGPLTTAKLAFFLRGKPLDSSKISRLLGVDFPTGFEEGISRTIEWYRENGWL
jgi:dihydroflavonol-4-reductase